MLKLVVRGGVEYGCCRHGRSVSVGEVPRIFGAMVVWVRTVDRKNATGVKR